MATVLLATDGSQLASSAVERGVGLLGRDHRFVLLTVVPPPYASTAGVTPMDTHPTIIDPELEVEQREADEAEATAELDRLAGRLGLQAERRVEPGDAGPTICWVAADVGADVVVIGSHGHGWLQRVLVGSASHHVVQHAPCPVLVMRPPVADGD